MSVQCHSTHRILAILHAEDVILMVHMYKYYIIILITVIRKQCANNYYTVDIHLHTQVSLLACTLHFMYCTYVIILSNVQTMVSRFAIVSPHHEVEEKCRAQMNIRRIFDYNCIFKIFISKDTSICTVDTYIT